MLNRRHFLVVATTPAVWRMRASAASSGATVLYADSSTAIEKIRPDAKELWVRAADLPRINGFEVKRQGACRADMCIPVPKDLKSGEWFNLTGFARRIRQAYVADAGV